MPIYWVHLIGRPKTKSLSTYISSQLNIFNSIRMRPFSNYYSKPLSYKNGSFDKMVVWNISSSIFCHYRVLIWSRSDVAATRVDIVTRGRRRARDCLLNKHRPVAARTSHKCTASYKLYLFYKYFYFKLFFKNSITCHW